MVKIADIHKQPDSYAGRIEIEGWIKTNRQSKAVGFIELTDGSSFKAVQVVYDNDNTPDETKKQLATGTALKIDGELVLTPDMKQPFEIRANKIAVVGECDPAYPLQKKQHSLEFLRTIQHLRPRTNTFQAVFRVRSIVSQAMHRFFDEHGFVYVHTPIFTGSDCEGAGEMFQVTTLDLTAPPKGANGTIDYTNDFFATKTYLTVSGQLYAEAFALAFKDIYTFGPTFRAENSNTARHAAEFWMLEPEMAFCDLRGNMDNAEAMVKYVIKDLFKRCPDELDFFNRFVDTGLIERLTNVMDSDFERITYTEAMDILKKSGQSFQFPVGYGHDIQTEHERYLAEMVFKKPVFVTDYPKEQKSFYMRMNDDGKTVAACDMMVPGIGELIGGSQREERMDVLLARMDELKLDRLPYEWYLDLRKYGGVPHAGYGLGFERMVMYVTGIQNIRDVLPFPRTTGNMLI